MYSKKNYMLVSVLFSVSGIYWGSWNVSPIDKGGILDWELEVRLMDLVFGTPKHQGFRSLILDDDS